MNLLDNFKNYLFSQEVKPSRITVKNYLSDVNHFIKWFEKQYGSFLSSPITNTVLDEYKIEFNRTFSPASMQRHLSSLRKFFKYLKSEGKMTMDPFLQSTIHVNENKDLWRLNDFKNNLFVANAAHLTIKNYIIDVKQFITWAKEVTGIEDNLLINRLDKEFVEEYKQRLIKDESFSPATVNRKLSSLRKYLTWAQNEGLLTQNLTSIENISKIKQKLYIPSTNSLDQVKLGIEENIKEYSKFPPLRLIQKFFNLGVLGFDTLFTAPLVKIATKTQEMVWKLKGQPIFEKGPQTLVTKNITAHDLLGIRNISKQLYAPFKISIDNYSPLQKLIFHARYTRPNWYKTYHSYAITHYFHFAVLVIFLAAVGFGIYNSFFTKPSNQNPALAVLPTAPPRILSFQGRLTDNNDNPITSNTNIRFAIYNNLTASGAALLWQEVNPVTPDVDGIFNAILGNVTSIPSTLFSENAALYLGVTIESTPELTPRQQLATVAYAANSETLQGLLPITGAGAGTSNVVLALDSSGNLTIGGSANPVFSATGGQFKISGQPLLLTTNAGTDANVQITTDDLGKIDLQKPILNSTNSNNIATAIGAVEVNDLFAVLATSSGQSAVTINQTSTGPIISASSGGTAKFTIDNSGNEELAGNLTLAGATGVSLSGNDADLTFSGTGNHDITASGGTLRFGAASLTGAITGGNQSITGLNNLSAAGTVTFSGLTSNQNSVLYAGSGGVIATANNTTGNLCLISDAGGADTPGWASCSTGTSISPFQEGAGFIFPNNSTVDFLVGGQATTSAKFAILNIAEPTSGYPTASISSGLNGYATYLNSNGNLGTTRFQTLNIGGTTTGDVQIVNKAGSAFTTFDTLNSRVGIGITAPSALLDISGTITTSILGLNLSTTITQTSGTSESLNISNTITPSGTSTNIGYGALIDSVYTANQDGTGANVMGIKGTARNTGGNTVGDVYGLNFQIGLTNSSTITRGRGAYIPGPSIASGSTLNNAYGLQTGAQFNTNGNSSTTGGFNSYGIDIAMGNQGGNTSGTNNNYGIKTSFGGGASGVGGITNNYGINVGVPAPTALGTNNNYALFITGNGGTGGTTNNYALYSESTSNSYLAGRLGINITAPSGHLEIQGSSAPGDIYLSNSDSAITATDLFGKIHFKSYDVSTDGTKVKAYIQGIAETTFTSSDHKAGIAFGTSYATNDPTTVMYLSGQGMLGLGTTTPTSEIHVTRPLSQGATGKSLAIFDQIENQEIITASKGGVTQFVLDGSGNVAIEGVLSDYTGAILDVNDTLNANALTSDAGVSIAAANSYTGAGAVTLSSGGGLGLTLDSASNTLTVAASDTILTASGITTVTLGTSATINAGATALNLQADGTPDVNIAGGSGSTGCTIANATGNLTCSGTISGSGATGYWNRSVGNIFPATTNDTISATSAASTVATFTTNNPAATLTNNTLINQTGAGTVTNLLNLTQTGGTATNALTFSGTFTKLINSTNFNVTNAGAVTAVGVDSGTGLIQGTGGITTTGATSSINASSNFATNIGTGTSNALVSIGGGSGTVAVSTTSWNITSAGAVSGVTTLTSSGSTTLGTGSTTTNTLGSGASSINTIGSVTTPGALTLHGATTLDNTFTVSGSNLTSLGGNLTVTGTAWTATPTISGLITATSGLTSNGTLDANGVVTLGDGGDAVTIDSNDLILQTTGAGSDITFNAVDQINLSDFITDANAVLYTTTTGNLTRVVETETGSQCLLSGAGASGVPTWGSCVGGITADSLDFDDFVDSMTVDAATDINLGTNALTIDLDSTGDFSIRDVTTDIATFADSGAITFAPTSGQSLSINLGGAGDLVVNTDDLYVDTSTGNVGIGDTSPSKMFVVGNGDLFQVDSSGNALAPTLALGNGTIARTDRLFDFNDTSSDINTKTYTGSIQRTITGTITANRTDYGLYNLVTVNSSDDMFNHLVYGTLTQATLPAGYTIDTIYGLQGHSQINSTTLAPDTGLTATTSAGMVGTSTIAGAATVTSNYGANSIAAVTGAATVANNIGIYSLAQASNASAVVTANDAARFIAYDTADGTTVTTNRGVYAQSYENGNYTTNGIVTGYGGYFNSQDADTTYGLFAIGTQNTGNTETFTNVYGIASNCQANSATVTITNCYGLYSQVVGTAGTITTGYGLNIANPTTTGTLTTNYGILVADQTGGDTSDYGIAIAGADTQALWISSAVDTTDAANGIAFGLSRDTNLYRSAANTLATDDSLSIAGTGTALTLSGAATTAINISNTGVTTDINLQNGETIDNNVDGTVAISGVITEGGSAVLSAADIDTCAEFIALVVSTGTCGSTVFSVSPTLTGTLTAAIANFSGAITATTLDTGQGANELYDMDQNVLTTSGPTFTNLTLTTAGNANIEIGRTDGSASTPFMDFHAGATAVDYDVRIIANSGTGVTGAGTLQISAGTLILSGTSTLTTSSLATFTTAATLGMTSTTTLNLGNNATISSNATALNLEEAGGVDINLGGGSGSTGCTVTNATGNLACSGDLAVNGDDITADGALTITSSGGDLSLASDVNIGTTNLGGHLDSYDNSTATSGTVYNGYFRMDSSPTSASTLTVVGLLGYALHHSNATVGISGLTGLEGLINNNDTTTPTTVTNAKGLSVSLGGNSGTITNTYGVYIGDVTAGTQTNTAYGLYSSDASAYNYFAGNVGIGNTAPNDALDVTGVVDASDHITSPYYNTGLWSVGENQYMPTTTDCNSGGTGVYCWNRNDSTGEMWLDSTGNLTMIGQCDDATAGTVCSDYAEVYLSDLTTTVEAGDLIALSSTDSKKVKKADFESRNRIIGAYSSTPGMLIGNNRNITIGAGGTNSLLEGEIPVALTGRVKVKVSTENGNIEVGDALIPSSIPGVASKATTPGMVIGRAMESYSGTNINEIVVFINVTWYDPDILIASTGDLIINNITPEFGLDIPSSYTLTYPFGLPVERIGAFSEIIVAKIKAGFIEAQQISTNSLAITTDNVSIAGQSLYSYIFAIVSEQLENVSNFNSNNITSPIASIDTLKTGFISPLGEDTSVGIKVSKDKIEIVSGNNTTNSAVASFDDKGNATLSGTLTSNAINSGDASISGTLRARRIIADQIEGLDIKAATIAANYITNVTNVYNSSDSAFPTIGASQSGQVQYAFDNGSYINIATFSSQLAYIENLNSVNGVFSQNLTAFGTTTLSDTSIVGQLAVGGSLILANNSINVLGNDLNLQPLRQGGISIMAGLIYIDTSGNVKIGNDATIEGTLYANQIAPINGRDLTFKLSSSSAATNNIVVKGASNSAVLSIDNLGNLIASGAASIAKLNINSIVAPALAVSPTEMTATGSAGTGKINAGRFEMTINNTLVTEKSLIYITPTSNTQNQVLYLIRQVPNESFTVGIQSQTTTDIPFNWIIIN